MLRHIPEKKREICAKLLRWITLASRPLSLNELAAAVEIFQDFSVLDQTRSLLDQLAFCGPFLKFEGNTVQLVHQSARDYLLRAGQDEDIIVESFRIEPKSAHLELARVCLEKILEYMSQEPPSICLQRCVSWRVSRISLDVLRGITSV